MEQAQKTQAHRSNRLLSAIDPEDFACLEPLLDIVELKRGDVIYDTGEFIRHAYFPHGSIVSLVNVMEDGHTVEVAVFGCEGVFGLLSAIVTRESFGRYIVRLSGTASRISIERLQEVRSARPTIRRLIMRYGEALLWQSFQIVSCNAVHSVEARCCSWILNTQDRISQEALPLTHEFLGEMLGVQRSTISIVLRTLQLQGLIEQGRGFIRVTDRAGVERSSCECYRRIRRAYERLLPHTYEED